jgi:hypothetical protein
MGIPGVLVAVARKLVVIVNAMLRTHTPGDANFAPTTP